MSNVSIIVKATRLCNLRCSYCHDWRAGPNQTMNFKVMSKMISSILSAEGNNMVEFIWHGGEPTLLPISFYEKALFVQSRFQKQGQIIINIIQTNGTNISESWINFLRYNKFIVGISIDGPPEIHDKYRRYESGNPSSTDVRYTLKMFKKWKIPFTVLMVIDEGAVRYGAKRIFDFFIDNDIKNYGFLAATPFNQPDLLTDFNPPHYVNSTTMCKFLIEMYDCWREHGDATIKITELESIMKSMIGKYIHCTIAGACFGKYFMVEPNGNVSHCDLFVGDPRYTLGNIIDTDFNLIRKNKKMDLLHKENELSLQKMKECQYFDICNGWCPHQKYLSVRHNASNIDSCCGLHELINYIKNNPPDFT